MAMEIESDTRRDETDTKYVEFSSALTPADEKEPAYMPFSPQGILSKGGGNTPSLMSPGAVASFDYEDDEEDEEEEFVPSFPPPTSRASVGAKGFDFMDIPAPCTSSSSFPAPTPKADVQAKHMDFVPESKEGILMTSNSYRSSRNAAKQAQKFQLPLGRIANAADEQVVPVSARDRSDGNDGVLEQRNGPSIKDYESPRIPIPTRYFSAFQMLIDIFPWTIGIFRILYLISLSFALPLQFTSKRNVVTPSANHREASMAGSYQSPT